MTMEQPTPCLIGTIRRYWGRAHPWALGLRVVVTRVHRGDRILRDDAEIGQVLPSDMIEFAPLRLDDDGVERASWVWSDARIADLGESEGRYEGPLSDTVVASFLDPRLN